ncbi:MAG TPA: hypothetical protein VFE88_01800 [Candidatus Nanoarchaeia archaeon]|nr:hypothetical protein [Candidatus Nanoarchaeia archaeon]
MKPEENAFQQFVAYLKAIGNPVGGGAWSTSEDDVHRYLAGFRVESVFAEERFLEDFKCIINRNLEERLERADSPSSLNSILHQAKDIRSTLLQGQVLIDAASIATRVAGKTSRWLSGTAYDKMESLDLIPLSNHLRQLLGDSETVRDFDQYVLTYLKIPLNEALSGENFESLGSAGTGAFRSVMGRFDEILRSSPVASSINLEDYLSTGLKREAEIVGEVMPELQKIRDAERDHVAYVEGFALVGNEGKELWVNMYEREKESLVRFQQVITGYDALRKVVTKLRNCFSPKFENEAVLADVYKLVDISDERFTFKFGQPPLLDKLREAEKTIEEIKGLYKRKLHKTVLYRGWFDHCYAQNRNFEMADKMEREIRGMDNTYSRQVRQVAEPLLKSHSLDFI